MTRIAPLPQLDPATSWTAPIEVQRFDRRPRLSLPEQRALQILVNSPGRWGDPRTGASARIQEPLRGLLDPLRDVMILIREDRSSRNMAIAALLRACQREQQAFCGWPPPVWCRVLGKTQAQFFQENTLWWMAEGGNT